MTKPMSLRLLQAALGPVHRQQLAHSWRTRRCFHATPIRSTDGVSEALTEMRVRTPWIEALRKSRKTGSQSAAVATDPVKPDLTPKKMSDSYFKFVCIVLKAADSRNTDPSVDSPPSSGSLAARYLCQFKRQNTPGLPADGPRRSFRSGGI